MAKQHIALYSGGRIVEQWNAPKGVTWLDAQRVAFTDTSGNEVIAVGTLIVKASPHGD